MGNLRERVRKLEAGTNDDELVELFGVTMTAGKLREVLAAAMGNALPIRHDDKTDDESPEADGG